MGFWKSLKKIGKKVFKVGNTFLGSGIGGAVTSLGGSLISSALSGKRAKAQRGWQEDMRGTSYQATMKDMRAAGLNPVLAYKQGAMGAGQGAQAQTPDFGASIATGRQAGSVSGLRKEQLALARQQRTNLIQEYESKMGTAREGKVLYDYLGTERGREMWRRNKEALTAPRAASEMWNAISGPGKDWFKDFDRGREHGYENPKDWEAFFDKWRKLIPPGVPYGGSGGRKK